MSAEEERYARHVALKEVLAAHKNCTACDCDHGCLHDVCFEEVAERTAAPIPASSSVVVESCPPVPTKEP